jgi:Tfp pilus assembly protein FimT
MAFRDQNGFTLLELLIIVSIIVISTILSTPFLKKSVEYFRFKSTTNAIKYRINFARSASIANTKIHCGVSFDFISKPQKATVFYDTAGTSYKYDQGSDPINGEYKLPQKFKIEKSGNNSIINDAIVFRGDGSTKYGGSILLKSENYSCTLNVLASTGRVKVY